MKRIQVAAWIAQAPDGSVLIGQRRKKDSNPLKWEFPGGKKHDEETFEEALVREIDEELNVRVPHATFFHEVLYSYPMIEVQIRFFHTKLKERIEPECRVHEKLMWVAPLRLIAFDFLEANLELLPLLYPRQDKGCC